jgi:isoleucyl-tRNA synthetase
MDYKDTLNLPRTEFAMKADLVAREPQRLEHWHRLDLYARIRSARNGRPKFVLHDGPPFANGDLHIGHLLNRTLKDIVVRHQTLRGLDAPFVPGWDCHGLPIEFKVTQELRKQGRTDTDPAAIRTACEAYARKYIDIQRDQSRRMGLLGDWDRPYVTLDREYEASELQLFADLVEQGFVYRGRKPVYWSIPCRTALAEAEVEYQDHVSPSIIVKFPVVDAPGMSILIWTTTPWTLPANLAVAYNSNFSYSLIRVGDAGETFIVSTFLLSTLTEKCGWDGYEIIRSLTGDQLAQVEYRHPFCSRTGRLYPGDAFVESSTGTGFVHIAPGHGLEDYQLGLQHKLPVYSPVDDDGCFIHTPDLPVEQQMPAALLGRSILEKHGKSDANTAVLDLLRHGGHLVHLEDYLHSYPHCWRSKTPVIFRGMDQWFIRIDHLRPGIADDRPFRVRALDEIGRVEWIPDWGQTRIEAAVKTRPDWCISRQRAWGVPIPAFYDAAGQPILEASIVRRAADLFRQQGSNAWFEMPLETLWTAVKPPDWTGPAPVAKSTDTLDVWIDSGSSSRCVTAARPELQHHPERPFQADMYLEGSDQHRGWFQSSLLLSLAGNGAAPFRTVLTHGFMVDADRKKVSKSGYEKPRNLDFYVNKWGADVMRLWVSSQDFRNDIVVSEERINKVGETYRVIRNALRYQLSNLYDFDPARDAVPDPVLTELDRWILAGLTRLENDVAGAYDRSEFHVVYQKVSQFAAVELSAIYHDVVKDRLYTDPATSPRRRSTQTALHRLVTRLCQMLASILAFTSDEAWELIPGRSPESVHLSVWQPAMMQDDAGAQATWADWFQLRDRVLPELEKARQAKLIGKALEARVTLRGGPAVTAERHVETLRELFNVSQLTIEPGTGDDLTVIVDKANGHKCGRCWHWETDVGSHASHPSLCGRCVHALGATTRTQRGGASDLGPGGGLPGSVPE